MITASGFPPDGPALPRTETAPWLNNVGKNFRLEKMSDPLRCKDSTGLGAWSSRVPRFLSRTIFPPEAAGVAPLGFTGISRSIVPANGPVRSVGSGGRDPGAGIPRTGRGRATICPTGVRARPTVPSRTFPSGPEGPTNGSMARPGSILAAILASIAGDLRDLTCLDITRANVARGLVPPRPDQIDGPCDLVIADGEPAQDLAQYCDESTLVLLLCGRDLPLPNPDHMVCRSRVRTGEQEWRLCVHTPQTTRHSDISLTVIVPVQDEADALERLLTVLAAEDMDPPWELILINRGSYDHTGALMATVRGSVRIIDTPRATPMESGVIAAIGECRSSHAVVLSPHWVPEFDWRSNLAAEIAAHRDANALVGTLVDGPSGRELPARQGIMTTPIAYRLPPRSGQGIVRAARFRVRQVPSGLSRRSALRLIEPTDIEEDTTQV